VLELQEPKLKTQNQQFLILMTTPKSPNRLTTLNSPKTDIAVSKLQKINPRDPHSFVWIGSCKPQTFICLSYIVASKLIY
jgi:hypothetical protein